MHQWLRDYKNLENEINYLEFNLERNKRELNRWTSGDLMNVKLTAESNGAQVEEIIEKIQYELAHKLNDLYDLKKLINTFDGLEYKILFKKHVEGKTLEEIAVEMRYSTGYIKAKHAEVMRRMKYAEKVSFK